MIEDLLKKYPNGAPWVGCPDIRSEYHDAMSYEEWYESSYGDATQENIGTSTTWRKGNVPHNKGKKDPHSSKHRKEYWRKWKEAGNITQRDIYVGHWSPHHRTDSTSALNKKMLTCPHCGKTTNVGNANRWHFDKCKTKP